MTKPEPVQPPQPETGSRFAKDNDPVFVPIDLNDQPEPQRPD